MFKKFLVVSFVIFSALVVSNGRFAEAAVFPLRINIGSDTTYTTSGGKQFLADQEYVPGGDYGYTGGSKYKANQISTPLGGSSARDLYDSQRLGWQEYQISGVANGTYIVTLSFAEQNAQGPEINVFDLYIEGQLVADNLDIAAEAGLNYAVVKRYVVNVTDGTLNIIPQDISGRTHLATLEVDAYTPTTTPPGTPSTIYSQSLYNAIGVHWSHAFQPDLAGYYVYRSASNSGGTYTQLTPNPVWSPIYVDHTVLQGVEYKYRIAAVDVNGNVGAPIQTANFRTSADITTSNLPVYELTIAPADWTMLNMFPNASTQYDGVLSFEGQQFPVELRYRGFFGRKFQKKSWKIVLPDANNSFGVNRINLNTDYVDWTMMRSVLSGYMYEQAGLQPPQADHALLLVNGEYQGVYTQVEQVDEQFLARTGRNPNTSIYKMRDDLNVLQESVQDYMNPFVADKETNTHLGFDDLFEFDQMTHLTPDETFLYELRNSLDVDKYLKYYAVNALIANVDFTWHNAYMAHDLTTDRWEVIPWDWDHTWGLDSHWDTSRTFDWFPLNRGDANSAETGVSNPLITRMLTVPEIRAGLCAELTAQMSSVFTPANLNPVITSVHNNIVAEGRIDWKKYPWNDSTALNNAPTQIKEFVVGRRAELQTQMTTFCTASGPFLHVNELMPVNTGAVCDPTNSTSCSSDWVEIYNSGFTAVNLKDYHLTNDLNNRTKHKFTQALIVPPGGTVVVWADGNSGAGANHAGFTLANNNGGVWLVAKNGNTVIDSLSYGTVSSSMSFGRTPDGVDQYRRFNLPTLDASNILQSPTITQVTQTPTAPTVGDTITVTATVTDDGQLLPVKLNYMVDGGGYQQLFMTLVGANQYQAIIPAQASGARVQYYVSADDADGNTTNSSQAISAEPHEFTVDYVPPTLIINEFMSRNENGLTDPQELDEKPDWIEIYNPGPNVVNLGGMSLTDDATVAQRFVFDDELALGVYDHLIIFADDDLEQGTRHANFKLLNSGEDVAIFDSGAGGNALLDGISYGSIPADTAFARCANGWQQTTTATPYSYNTNCAQIAPMLKNLRQIPQYPQATDSVVIRIRAVDNGPFSAPKLNWSTGGGYTTVTMSAIGGGNYQATIPAQAAGTTVDYYLSVTDATNLTTLLPADAPTTEFHYRPNYTPQIYINEVQANNRNTLMDPQEPDEAPDWIELHNPGTTAVNIGGMYLTNDSADSTQYQIPAGTIVPAGGFIIFYADDDPEQGGQHTNFTLAALYGQVSLFESDGILQIDSLEYRNMGVGMSIARVPNGTGTASMQSCVSAGSANGCGVIYLPIITKQ